ncbi:phosphopantetheine-binding protein [Sphingomonas abaci]|uniref:Acyl carrier protein n=1 Tax=Sphingomonas abaci TaxID=237611 RepID=A0A7W7AJH2_9SPHN|nr:acyl carrier protein [Sphingomonas abaci]
MTDTAHKVAVIVSRELRVDLDRCTPDAVLESLGADKPAIAGIVVDIEDELNAAICSDATFEAIRTIADLIAIANVAAPRAIAA